MDKVDDSAVPKTNEPDLPVSPDVPPTLQETTSFDHFPSKKPKTKNLLMLIAGLLLLSGLAASMVALRTQGDIRSKASNVGPVLSLLPASNTVEIGQEKNIAISINTNARLVTSVHLDIAYNKDAIDIVKFTKGPKFQNALQEPSTDNGKITAILTTPITTPFNGTANVAIITIKVKTAGESTIRFTNDSTVTVKGTTGNALAGKHNTTITGVTQITGTITPTNTPPTSTPVITPNAPTNTPTQTRLQCAQSCVPFQENPTILINCLTVCDQINKAPNTCVAKCNNIVTSLNLTPAQQATWIATCKKQFCN